MSPAYRFHPEFGYFCPSDGFRHKLRVGLVCVIIGVMAGIGGTFVLKAARDHVANRALTSARVDESLPHAPATSAAGPAALATPEEKSGALEGGKSACDQDTWAYLDGSCVAPRTRKARNARSATDGRGIATIPLGRNTPPLVGSEHAPVVVPAVDRHQPSSPPPGQSAAVAATEAAASSASAEPSAQPAAAPKKIKKTVRRARDRHHDAVARRDARAREAQLRDRGAVGGGGMFGGGPFGFLFR